jgi:hypothetical protein
MKIAVDSDVLGGLAAGISADNRGYTAGRLSNDIDLGVAGTPLTIGNGASDVDPIDIIVLAGQVLDEQNIPETGRWIVIPPWFSSRVKRSELKDASLTGDGTSVVRNGRLGMIDRFTLYSSNLLPKSAGPDLATSIFAGHSGGLTFAAQLTNVETLRAESTFGTLMRGLMVYGSKMIRGEAVVEIYAKPGAMS